MTTTLDRQSADDLRDLVLRVCGVVETALRDRRSHGGPWNPDVHRVQGRVEEIRDLLAARPAASSGLQLGSAPTTRRKGAP